MHIYRYIFLVSQATFGDARMIVWLDVSPTVVWLIPIQCVLELLTDVLSKLAAKRGCDSPP